MTFDLPNQLSVEINPVDLTASIINCKSSIKNMQIPQSFLYKSQEYIITKIKKDSFNNKTKIENIIFPYDSGLISIESGAISCPFIKSIIIPKSVKELEDGWFSSAAVNLTRVTLSPNNTNYAYLNSEQNIIIGKSDNKSATYDVLVFANRDIRKVNIPSYIKRINSSAFSHCAKLKNVTFDENSELLKIGDNSFSYCNITSINIPSSVREIGDSCFAYCYLLNSISFDADSQLTSLGKNVFQYSSIEIMNLPIHLKKIEDKSFYFCKNLQTIRFPDDSEIEEIGESSFENSSILSICIHKNVKKINEKAFLGCLNLEKIDFSDDSKLEEIGKNAFSKTSIKGITIPSHVKQIEEGTFIDCKNIYEINFKDDSELVTIQPKAFFYSSIEKINIPSNVVDLQDGWCIYTIIHLVSISPKNPRYTCLNDELILGKTDSLDGDYDTVVFGFRDLPNIQIPSFIKYISPYAFHFCKKLDTVEFTNDSELISIGKSAFELSGLNDIIIPRNVEVLQEYTFSQCHELYIVDFQEDSKLKQIENRAFYYSSLRQLMFPDALDILCDGWCDTVTSLFDIQISPNNKNFSYLNGCSDIIVGKSDQNIDSFDTLCFASRFIESANIPSYIKAIDSFSFSSCKLLTDVTFDENSQLSAIKHDSFRESSIKGILIPKHVEVVEKNCFAFCDDLQRVIFEENSELVSIEDSSFMSTIIKSIKIPKSVKIIGDSAFRDSFIEEIEFEQDSNLNEIDKSAFGGNRLMNVSLPRKLQKVKEKVFQNCANLNSIEFLSDELEINFQCIEYLNVFCISCPNARTVSVCNVDYLKSSRNLSIFTCKNAVIV